MQLKTVSSLSLAFLLVVGVVGVASAQEVAATQGIAIRVDKPAANTFVAIGDTIVLRVLTFQGLLDNPEQPQFGGFNLAIMDTGRADRRVTGGPDDKGNRVYYFSNQYLAQLEPGQSRAGSMIYIDETGSFVSDFNLSSVGIKGVGAGIDTFTVLIPVASGVIETDSRSLKVVVQPRVGGVLISSGLSNLMTDKKITPATVGFGATAVGDGVQFGIDNRRPLHGEVFTSITLDLDPLSTDTTDQGEIDEVMINTEDKFRVNLNLNTAQILGARADRIEVGIVPTDSIAVRQAAPLNLPANAAEADAFQKAPSVKLLLRGDRLYNTNPRLETEIEAGTFKDNQRVEILAYLVDVAGNVGGTATEATAADWKDLHGTDVGVLVGNPQQDLMIIADATAPTITVIHPNPDSIAAGSQDPLISAEIMQTLSGYLPLPGEVQSVQTDRELNPLEFKLSEVPYTIKLTHGDSVLTLTSGLEDDSSTRFFDESGSTPTNPLFVPLLPSQEDSTATVDFSGWFDEGEAIDDSDYEAAGGTSADLKIEVWDSLGNKTEMTIEGITLDGNHPEITNLFPTADTAPKDADNEDEPTINLITKNPAFQINEELDSLSIRYHEDGGGNVILSSYGPGNQRLETVSSLVTWPVNDTTFIERQGYILEVLAIDLAGNGSLTKGGTLKFKKGFGNPDADMFKFAVAPEEKQVAGVDVVLTVSVLDTTLSRIEETDVRAVTYHTPSAVAVIVSGDQADALEGVTFSGTGVSAAPSFALPAELAAAGMVAKAAILNRDGWHAGQREVKFKAAQPLTGATVMAAEGSIDPATGSYTLRISGQAAKTITVSVAELSKFVVTAIEGQISGSNVAGAFTVNVVPTDAFGNASMKIENTVDSKTYESVAVNFSSSNAAVTTPSGQQMVPAGGADFGAVAADINGSATISVRSVAEDYATGAAQDAADVDDKRSALTGSVSVNIVSGDGPGPGPDPGAPAAVANVVVRDYKGADGQGDQGGIVVVSFPNSSQHDAVSHYQIHREIDSSTGLDEEGSTVELDEPVKKWVEWTSVSFAADAGDEMGDAGGDMQTVIVPAIDNVATNWGVTAVSEAGESGMTTVSKRVFTKESIQQTLQLLGMAPEAELLTDEELSNQFNAPEDYVKSLIGDQKNVIFAPVNPDVSALIGSASVAASIRTAAGSFLSSARTVTEEPVAAVDNIAPAAVTDASGAGGVVLQWTASANDGVVGSIPYRGYNIPILGVKGYTVLRGTSADDLEEIATLPSGSTQFTDDNVPDGAGSLVYRIDAFDDNNVAMGQLITVDNISVRMTFVDANGDPVYLIVLPSQGGNMAVDFEDFVAFAAAFNSQKGDANYNPQADVDDDGTVDFSDYVTAAASFGRTAVVPAGSKLAIAPQRPGVNADTDMTLELTSETVKVGETISVTVSMANARQLNGFGLELKFDAEKFEFVSAVPAADLLKSQGDETPLFRNWPEEGRISVVNAIIDAGSVSGEGALVTFTFKVLREFEDNARFEIAQGVVFDADQLQNPVVSLGALDVQSTPTEFALHQNFPNPFNPQTNIPYDLAESGDVALRIYNLLGQEVRTLVRERQQAGRYTVQWSGMDDRGVSVSSGIYFYQVSVAGKFQDARRLMLLK